VYVGLIHACKTGMKCLVDEGGVVEVFGRCLVEEYGHGGGNNSRIKCTRIHKICAYTENIHVYIKHTRVHKSISPQKEATVRVQGCLSQELQSLFVGEYNH